MTVRRVGRLAVAISAVLFLVGLPGANPTEAAVHNLFPADVDGFPKGRFRADDALFVTLTSDTTGGTVCVVEATVTDPTKTDCKSPRWGSPNRYVGIGTLLGYPLEAPLLPVGDWKLLATGPDGTGGTELSEPFEVVSCSPTCDTGTATSQLAPWKAAAAKQLPTAAGARTAVVIDIATRTYKIANGLYAGAGFGLGWALAGGAWAAADFDFVVPSTQDLAKAIYKQLSETVRAMYADIAADPPDFDYGTVPAPVFSPLAPTGDALLDDYLETLMRAEAFGKASRIANERYQGAVIDAAHAQAAMQAQATADLTFDLNTELRRLQDLQSQVADLSWAGEPIVVAPDGQDPVTWWSSMVAELPQPRCLRPDRRGSPVPARQRHCGGADRRGSGALGRSGVEGRNAGGRPDENPARGARRRHRAARGHHRELRCVRPLDVAAGRG
ncbi:hypothetical protein ACE2AJ_14700 [Aquihabitans daechungensis]|uniref:hypothetical protein n=1 Tax=Aquihabitans daechungensis TaxID=1052257 RepID=UPI003BA05B44